MDYVPKNRPPLNLLSGMNESYRCLTQGTPFTEKDVGLGVLLPTRSKFTPTLFRSGTYYT